MLFTSVHFLLFFAIGSFFYYLAPKRTQWILLLVLSITFYLAGGTSALPFLLISILSTYASAIIMEKIHCEWKKRLTLSITLALNLGALFLLKYYGYFANIVNLMLTRTSILPSLENFNVVLPIGISFYTLQTAGYCIDIYRGKYPAERNLAKYALFALFFPAILQGPIGRYDALAHQLTKPHEFNEEQIVSGLELMLWGYFKKMVIADRAAILVNQVYSDTLNYVGLELLIAAVFYSFQLYADFSGYMDIATGIAEVFGIHIAQNFNRPYFSRSIQEFWRRWHMTLSFWLRDYLYIPLGGNRKGKVRKYINILFVFFVSGIWHGVGIHYIIWGLLHGMYQVVGALLMPLRNQVLRFLNIDRTCLSHRIIQSVFTFFLVTIAWIFFRAPNTSAAIEIISLLFSKFNPWILFDGSLYSMGLNSKNFWLSICSFSFMLFVEMFQHSYKLRNKLHKQNWPFRLCAYITGLFAILIFGVYGSGYNAADFIYMQF